MQKFPNLKNPSHFIVTLGGIGLFPLAPGTVGSIFGWIIFIVLSHYIEMIFATVLIIFLSIYVSNLATKDIVNKDHKSIVIDEMAGIWLAMIPVIYIASSQYERTIYAILALIFFRLFDILKPYPISYVDKNFKGGFGIVLDDLIAGVFAGILAMVITIYLI
tara:strand:+ start:656 stop:1141 length:486 start_codon:yes stop_codon:yes gene_type:complete